MLIRIIRPIPARVSLVNWARTLPIRMNCSRGVASRPTTRLAAARTCGTSCHSSIGEGVRPALGGVGGQPGRWPRLPVGRAGRPAGRAARR